MMGYLFPSWRIWWSANIQSLAIFGDCLVSCDWGLQLFGIIYAVTAANEQNLGNYAPQHRQIGRLITLLKQVVAKCPSNPSCATMLAELAVMSSLVNELEVCRPVGRGLHAANVNGAYTLLNQSA